MAVEDNTEGRVVMTSYQKAYLAGLIDGDGSLMLQIKPRPDVKYRFRIKATIVIYQDTKLKFLVKEIHDLLQMGYIYDRNDHITEIRIEGFSQVKIFLTMIKPYLRFKLNQAILLLQAIKIMQKATFSITDFLKVCKLADEISNQNYVSKTRKYTYQYVVAELKSHYLLPVTTGALN